MRYDDEAKIWKRAIRNRPEEDWLKFEYEGLKYEIQSECAVVAGINGTGKSRLLRHIDSEFSERSLLIDISKMTRHLQDIYGEEVLDIESIQAEPESIPDEDTINSIRRVVGKNYSKVAFYDLDAPESAPWATSVDRFVRSGEDSIFPVFRVVHDDIEYWSWQMGQGELAAHLLFWLLHQRSQNGESGLVLLLDEPDAFLPDDTAAVLLRRILMYALGKGRDGWRVVVTTHSSRLIKDAFESSVLLTIYRAADGRTALFSGLTKDDVPGATGSSLSVLPASSAGLARLIPGPRYLFLVEDEAAKHFAQELLRAVAGEVEERSTFLWTRHGASDLASIWGKLSDVPNSDIRIVFVADGDERVKQHFAQPQNNSCPLVFLPGVISPEDNWLQILDDTPRLAAEMGVTEERVAARIRASETEDPHDIMSSMATLAGGRPEGLAAIARVWIEKNPQAVREFKVDLTLALSGSSF